MKPHELVAQEVCRERERQMAGEGWSPEHDDGHDRGEMALAAAAYAWQSARASDPAALGLDYAAAGTPSLWPWGGVWWKPKDPRRDLIRAAALLVAEIERLDRAAVAEVRREPAAEAPPALYRLGAWMAARPWPLSALGLRLCAAVMAWTFRHLPEDVAAHAMLSAAELVVDKAARGAGKRG